MYLTAGEAENHCRAGASVWNFCSTDGGLDPDVVICGIGVEVTFEVVCAVAVLRQKVPELRVRMVNVTDLMVLDNESVHPHALSNEAFDNMFTKDKAIHFNFHGYATELQGLLFGRPRVERATIAGYSEEGTTTTPFDMMLVNGTSRFHVAQAAVRGASLRNEKVRMRQHELCAELEFNMKEIRRYILQHHEGEQVAC